MHLSRNSPKPLSALQETVTELKNNHRVLSDKHNLLQNENAQLKVQLSDMQETFLGKLSKQTPNIPSLPTSNENVYAQKKTLILGDSMLRDVSASSLCNASVKSISGGTIYDIFQEIDQMAHVELSSYSDIIIHAGTNDISRKNDVQAFTDSMEAIITNIMFKSPTSSTHNLCNLSTIFRYGESITKALKTWLLVLPVDLLTSVPELPTKMERLMQKKLTEMVYT